MAKKSYFYHLKISLSTVKPVVWREFVVPGTIPLDLLHDVIQAVMGWRDTHLHEFVIKGENYTEYPPENVSPVIAEEIKAENHDESLTRLQDVVSRKGQTFDYLYDFGDYWMHQLKVIDRLAYDEQTETIEIECLNGENACPPDDCGGPYGYLELKKAIDDPKHPEHEDILMWLGGDFEPLYFDPDEATTQLAWLQRWSRRRKLWWFE